ncbi:choice-of-anchor L domain-containing protein [Flavilitoribacter nigricans]|nr:choice-of-anchor L domain-containing protein [Flavilitoribacter nigricans]
MTLNNWCFFSLLGVVLVLGAPVESLGNNPEGPGIPKSEGPPNKTIRTEVGLTPEELVRNVFVAGTCDNISKIKGLGNPDGIGYFENGNAAIGLDRGIILATGPVAYAANSNSAGDKSGDFGDKSGDSDLGKLASTSIRDRVGLEFDFVPLDSFVTFRYVFASEEYCEFVGSKYNDVFGFFVSGPGIEGGFTGNAENVALIPGSADYVSINNVNHKKNSQYYIDNTRNHDAERCGFPYVASEREKYIEYDGFTVRLTARLRLTPCETYHIRLVVADVADNFYDSAVFLEAGSFDLGGQISVKAITPSEEAVSEGCSGTFFEFKRDNPSVEFPMSVRFRLTDETTAAEGTDFGAFPSFITIPAGQRTVRLPIEVFNDALVEGEEKIAIELDIPCACYSDGAEVLIDDPPDLIVQLDDLAICPEQTEYLIPEVSGGNPGYQYAWSDGSTSDRLLIEQIQEEPYYLTVTDQCGHEISVSAKVTPTQPPRATISGIQGICAGDTARIEVNFTGIAPWNFTYSIDGEPIARKEGIKSNPYFLDATRDGDYELIEFSDAGCSGEVQGLGSVSVYEIPLGAEASPVSCAGSSDGRIVIDLTEDFPPYQYSWEEVPGNTSKNLNNASAGDYTFRVRDGRGCSSSIRVSVEEPPALIFPELDCESIRDGSWRPVATGGTGPYDYYLNGSGISVDVLAQSLEAGNYYELEIVDSRGCTVTDSLLAPYLGESYVSLPPSISLLLGSEYQLMPDLSLPQNLLAGVRWLPGENLSCDDCLNPFIEMLEDGNYTIRVIDKFGCTDEATSQIILNTEYPIFIPNVFSPNGDEKNDRFGVMSHAAVISRILNMTLYNRWGNQIFQVRDVLPDAINASWDGTAGGRPAPPGIYVYQMEIELANGRTKILTGDVLLLR